MLISKILSTLPDELKHFVNAWNSSQIAQKTVENLIARLIAEEARNCSKEEESNTVAFKTIQQRCFNCNKTDHLAKTCRMKTNTKDKSRTKCFKCNKQGHIAKYCSENRNNSRDGCSICKRNNHKEKDCYYRNKKESKKEDLEKMAFLTSKLCEPDTWIVDTGSTSNMTNDKSYFKSI